MTFADAISGTGALVKSGGGTLSLTGANSYSSGTAINGGTLAFTAGSVGSTGTIALNSGTLQFASGNTQDISGRLSVGFNTTIDTNGNDVSFGQSFAAQTVWTKTGTGTLTLSAVPNSSNSSSTIVVRGGTLEIKNDGGSGDFRIAFDPTGGGRSYQSHATHDPEHHFLQQLFRRRLGRFRRHRPDGTEFLYRR